ncbi:MAG: glycosyltransferase family 39 protein [Candidatus Nitrosocosmicus sp.]|nr:glycosyltransferase family 39 protein [Candidatus Nitrosocosmicus sp.]
MGAALLYNTAADWVYWKYDDVEHMTVAQNFMLGKGLLIETIDKDASNWKTNIPDLEKFDQISSHLRSKLPLYFVFLSGWLYITNAKLSDLYLQSTIFNFILSAISIVLFYYLVKIRFGPLFAPFSAILLASMPGFLWFAVRVRPDVLSFIFMILTVYFASKQISVQNTVLTGIFIALAHFSHPTGLFVGLAIIIFYLLKKKTKLTLVLIGTWIAILIPWLVRNYLIFGDSLQGTGIPIPRNIQLYLGLISPDVPNYNVNEVGNFSMISIVDTVSGLIKEFSDLYGMESFLIFITFSIFAFIAVSKFMNISFNKKIIILVGIMTYSFIVFSTFIFLSENDYLYLQILIFFILPLSAFLVICVNKNFKDALSVDKNDTIAIIGLITILSLLVYFFLAQVTGRVTPEVRFLIQPFYFLIPLSLLGISRILNTTLSFLDRSIRSKIILISFIIITISLSGTLLVTGINSINSFQKQFAEKDFQIDMHQWMNSNIEEDSKIASDLPHIVNLRTGLESVNFAHSLMDVPSYEKWIIKKFDIDYLVFYYYADHYPYELYNLDLGNIHLKKVYEGNDGGLIYKVLLDDSSNLNVR